jgi:Sigma-70 region 2
MVQPAARKANLAALDDAELVRRALNRDADAFATIMQRHNQRLYRIARSVLRNSAEAEDAVQEAYVAAFTATFASRVIANATSRPSSGRLASPMFRAAVSSASASSPAWCRHSPGDYKFKKK